MDGRQSERAEVSDRSMFSIIVPTHNRAHLLPRAIQSVLDQTLTDWELIIVDDGSTDNTRQVVEGFDDPRIYYHYQEHAGAASARNSGARGSRSLYLTFLDSDDEALPEWLERFASAFDDPQVAIVCGGAIQIVERDHSYTEILLLPRDYGALYYHQTVLFLAGAFALRRELFEAVGGYKDMASRQQKDLAMRVIPYCLEQGWIIQGLQVAVVKWFCHEGDRIGRDVQAQYEGAKSTLHEHGEGLLVRSRKRYAIYCGVAGVNAFKLGKHDEARTFFWDAVRHYPWRWKYYASFFLSLIPPLGHIVWGDNRELHP